MDFLFHKISEKERQEIKKQVDSILQSFSKKLSGIKKNIGEVGVEREEFERDEDGNPLELNRNIMLENAPEKSDNFIIAEKKKW